MHCAQVAGVAGLKTERAHCTLLSGAVVVLVRSASHLRKRAVCELESAGAKAGTCQMVMPVWVEWWWAAANSSLVIALSRGGVMRGEQKTFVLVLRVQAMQSAAARMKANVVSFGSAVSWCEN
eukprot:14960947-Ditylum_brightwellii.AAC.1